MMMFAIFRYDEMMEKSDGIEAVYERGFIVHYKVNEVLMLFHTQQSKTKTNAYHHHFLFSSQSTLSTAYSKISFNLPNISRGSSIVPAATRALS